MLLGSKHVDNLEREVHFHSEKSSSKGLEPFGPSSKICFFVSSKGRRSGVKLALLLFSLGRGEDVGEGRGPECLSPSLEHLPARTGAVSMASH